MCIGVHRIGAKVYSYHKGKEVIGCCFCIRAGTIHLHFVKNGVGLMTAIWERPRVMV